MAIDPLLLRLLGAPPKTERNSLADLVAGPMPPTSSSFGSLAPWLPTTLGRASTNPFSSLGTSNPLLPTDSWLDSLLPKPASVKRKVYFAFDFDDLIRVNNVRQVGKLDRPEVPNARTFSDRSIWESRDIKDIETLKRLMRERVKYSSVVCVLVGTNTWKSRWVKYEIARSIIDQKGLLVAHINGLNHNHRRMPDPLGFNLLNNIGIFRSVEGRFYIWERRWVTVNFLTGHGEWQWRPYGDHRQPVPLAKYVPAPSPGCIQQLAPNVDEYDYVASAGHKNIGAWIDRAAVRAGR